MATARAVMKSVESCGTYIDPNTAEVKIQILFNVDFIGNDGTLVQDQATAIVSFTLLSSAFSETFRQAVVDRGSALGFTLGIGDIMLLGPARF